MEEQKHNEIIGLWCDKCSATAMGQVNKLGACLYNKCGVGDCDGRMVWKWKSDEEKLKNEWNELFKKAGLK